MCECNLLYTNLADSVIFANFKGHQYGNNNENVSFLYKDSLIDFLSAVNNDRNSDVGVIMSLNQICDNRFLNLENQEDTFNLISGLIRKGKLKISYYNGYDLVSYMLESFKKCIKRLSKGDISPNMVYISSLFPELGIDNKDFVSRRRLKFMLGYDPSYIKYIGDDTFELKIRKKYKYSFKKVSFEELEKKSVIMNKYGIYTALKKYSENPHKSRWLTVDNLCVSDPCIVTWIKNFVELNRLAEEYNALIPNVSECTLQKVMSGLLNNEELINEKLDFWLGNTKNRQAIKEGIKEILQKLTEDSNRTAMYINIKTYMNELAEKHKENEALFRKFSTVTEHKTKTLSYQRVFFTILNIVDYAYNLLNMFFSTSNCMILEEFLNFKSESGKIIHEDKLQISLKQYRFDENDTLIASESDNLNLNNIIKKLIEKQG